MRTIRNLLLGAAVAAVWPALIALAAYAARQAPWPRSVALPSSTFLALSALAALVAGAVRWLFGPGGWAEDVLGMPPAVTRQVSRAVGTLVAAALVVLAPAFLITLGLVAPGGRPVSAPSVVRGLILAFELTVFGVAAWALRSRSPLVSWLSDSPAHFTTLARHRRAASAAALAAVAAVIALDALGYSYSARRLSSGAVGSLGVAVACWGVYRVLLRVIDEHAWRWIKVGQALKGHGRAEADEDSGMPDDLAGRLRRLSGYLSAAVGVLGAAWVWDIDLALFRFMSERQVWAVATGKGAAGNEVVTVAVTVGDLTRALALVALTAAGWRHLHTFFAVAVFPRLPDDPGIRFAVVTLCRYAVLAVGVITALSAVHLGLEKVGMVLAALGVGLGFGLQEIVSNFVCGIILLLERPIRVGDIVTVSGMNGKVDRINIRATTIINGDNQSIIVPNRAFITGDLVNWTLKDKIVRVQIKVKVASGADPDRVSELLLEIARDDADVLRNPVPSALVEELTDGALTFALSVHVPEPGLTGRVRHRLVRQIQQRFKAEGILLPVPTQKLLVDPAAVASFRTLGAEPISYRADPASTTPPPPLLHPGTPARPTPAPLEDCHRGVDE